MTVIKIIAKILLLPVVAVLTIIQWAGIFLNSISGVILGVLAFIFTLTGIASLMLGLASVQEGVRLFIVAFVIFVIPHIGDWLIVRIIHLRCVLGDFIRS